MAPIAYALRADHQGTVIIDGAEVPRFTGGLLKIDDARELDVRAELDAGNGTIIVAEHDALLLNRLDAYDALKRVSAGDADAVTAGTRRYEDLTVDALREEAKRRGLTIEAGVRKSELAHALAEHDVELSDGNTAVSPTPTHQVDVTPAGDVAPQEA